MLTPTSEALTAVDVVRRMTSDLDIYRSAQVLIREHDEDAALEAAQRADAMLEKGDMEGAPRSRA